MNDLQKLLIEEIREAYSKKVLKSKNRKKGSGGKREGSGRKSIGVTKKISVTLPQEDWDYLLRGCGSTYSSAIRTVIENYRYSGRSRETSKMLLDLLKESQ